MKQDSIEISSLVDIFENTSLMQICNSDITTNKGAKTKSFYVASTPSTHGYGVNLYQVSLQSIPNNCKYVKLYVNILHMVKGNGNLSDCFFLNPNSKETKFGALHLQIPADQWDILRNGVLSGVFDYIEADIEHKLVVAA